MSQAPQLGLFDVQTPEALKLAYRAMEDPTVARVEMAVLKALILPTPRLGKREALSIAAMQHLWRSAGQNVYNERAIKGAVKELIEQRAVPIGSCRIPGEHGYYLITLDAEAKETVRPWKSEIRSLVRRIKALDPNSAFVRALNGQLDIDEEGEAA